jgi:DNA-binding transcriptional regulator GbsR (MarR family)
MIKNYLLVMKTLYWNGGEMDTEEISRDTGLKRAQVSTSVFILRKLGYVKVRRIPIHWENGIMINNRSFIKLANTNFTEKNLKSKGLL